MDAVMIDQHSKNAKDLLENRDRMIREMAAAIATGRNGNGDDTGAKPPHDSSASSQIVKLNEWNTWCNEIRKFTDGTAITEDKICLFLPECIIPRFKTSQSAQKQPQQSQAQQQSGQQQSSSASNGPSSSNNSEDSSQMSESASPIEIYSALKAYVAVLVSQYLHQRRSGLNSHPHPHGVLLKAYLQQFRKAASVCRNIASGHSNGNGSSSSNSSATRHSSYHNHAGSRSHHQHNTQQRLIDSEYGERHTVPGLSPDVSDSEFDSFSDDGLAQSPGLLNGAVPSTVAGNGMGGTLSHNPRSLNGGGSGGPSGSARIEAVIQSNVQLMRDSLQYVISMQTDKLSQQLTRENNELRLALDKQARSVNALSAMIDKIAAWASTQAPELATEIAPSYRTMVSLNGSQPGSGAPGASQSVPSVQLTTSQPQQTIRRDTNSGSYMTTSTFSNTTNTDDSIFDGNVMTATTSHDDSNNINIFKMAAATAAAARRHQIDQHPIAANHSHSHHSLQQHEFQASRRQNKAPTQAQQRHIQHQQAADPYMMNVPTNGNANVMTNMEQLDMVVPQYRMSREVSTVPDLWEEWDSGLNGGPVVRELEEKYGTRWRQNSAERKFFCLRKVIIDYITRICGREGISIEESVNRVEEIRKANQFTSLQRLAEHLKKIRKIG
ncbi:transcriptional activator of glycolytic enzymes-domain-containing protein [Lipomyces kononenkoae]|uniref:Transcriptional activator of glycolytic enzymes-domain-containing protein n=1 Tax=Lipomyces kononenkoae TaxID=34357 RepID=A0ACC3T2X2_LIPKO